MTQRFDGVRTLLVAATLGMSGAGDTDVELRVFSGLNRLLVPDPGGDPMGDRARPVRAVPRSVLGTLADWLADMLGGDGIGTAAGRRIG